MAKEALDARAAFRLPVAVLAEWKAKADSGGYRNLSDFLRAAVDAARVTGIATPNKRKRKLHKLDASDRCDPKLIAQLAHVGNNINQIARALHSCRRIGAVVEVAEVLSVLLSIEQQASRLFPQLPLPREASPETVEAMAKARESRGAKKNAT